MLDQLQQLIRQQTTRVGVPVGNLHGAPVTRFADTTGLGEQAWLVLQVPATVVGSTLPDLGELYQAIFAQPVRSVSVVRSTTGAVVVRARSPEAPPVVTLLRGVVRFAADGTLPIAIDTGTATAPLAVYVDGVLARRGTGTLALTLALEPGEHVIEIVAMSLVLGVAVPVGMTITAGDDAPPPPVWDGITTDYLDPQTGTVKATLRWYADRRAGGWRVLRREAVDLSPIVSVSATDDSGTRTVVLTGDVESEVAVGGQLYAATRTLGTVLSVALASDGTTVVRVLAPEGPAPRDTAFWTGLIATTGAFTEVQRIARSAGQTLVSWTDTALRAGVLYQYALQASSFVDGDRWSGLSEIRSVVPGDNAAPGPIVLAVGYPRVIDGRAGVRFTTPADSDYQGVEVVQRASLTGTASGGTATTLTVPAATFTPNTLEDWRVRLTGGAGSGQERVITDNTDAGLTVDPAWDSVPDGTTAYLVYQDTPVVTDFGVPGSTDQLSFIPLGYGTYLFRTFDRAGNRQLDEVAVTWVYSAADDETTGLSDLPPTATIRQLTSAEQVLIPDYEDITQVVVVEITGDDPAAGPTNVLLYYQTGAVATTSMPATTPALTSGGVPVVDNPSGTRSRFIAVPRTASDARITVWANDALDGTGKMSPKTTFAVDFDPLPEFSLIEGTLEPRELNIEGTFGVQRLTVTADDDCQSFRYYVDPASAAVPGVGNPFLYGDTSQTKTQVINVPLGDGQRRVVYLTPYSGTNATGVAGETVWRAFSRPPRTQISVEDRDEQGNRTASTVRLTFRTVPEFTVLKSGTVTSATSTTLTLGVGGMTVDEYKSSDPLQQHYYVRITGGTGVGQVRRITGNTAQQLTVARPWTTTPAGDSTYAVVNGAVLWYTGAGSTGPADFQPTFQPVHVARTTSEFVVEYYAVITGCEPEELKRLAIDPDTVAEIASVVLEDLGSQRLRVSIAQPDDDVKTWRAYQRKGAWPTADGTEGGALAEPYRVWESGISRTSYVTDVTAATYYVIVVPTNSFNDDGPRVTNSITLGGGTASGAALTTADATHASDTSVLVSWGHTAQAETDGCVVKVKWGASADPGTQTYLGAAVPVQQETGGATSVALVGSLTQSGRPVHSASGTTLAVPYHYTVELYAADGTTSLGSKACSLTRYEVQAPTTAELTPLQVIDIVGGFATSQGSCYSPHRNTLNWNVTGDVQAGMTVELDWVEGQVGGMPLEGDWALVAAGISATATDYVHAIPYLYHDDDTPANNSARYWSYRVRLVQNGTTLDSATVLNATYDAADCVSYGGGKELGTTN